MGLCCTNMRGTCRTWGEKGRGYIVSGTVVGARAEITRQALGCFRSAGIVLFRLDGEQKLRQEFQDRLRSRNISE